MENQKNNFFDYEKIINKLILPEEPKVNPHYQKVKGYLGQWVLDNEIYPEDSKQYKLLINSDLTLLASYFFCEIDEDILTLESYYMFLIFAVDDILDIKDNEAGKDDFDGLLKLASNPESFIQNDQNSSNSPKLKSLVKAYQDFIKKLMAHNKDISPLLKSMKDTLQANQLINLLDSKDMMLKKTDFYNIRSYGVGFEALFIIHNLAYKIEDKFKVMSLIHSIANRHTSSINDIFSYQKESEENYGFAAKNIIASMEKKYDMSLEDSLDQAIKNANDEMTTLLEMKEAFKDDKIHRDYIDMAIKFVCGHVFWYKRNMRY